jgi:pyruvate,water dikinase
MPGQADHPTDVLPLTAATDHRRAGRKAATLARLAGRGLPVPPGVVITADVFARAAAPGAGQGVGQEADRGSDPGADQEADPGLAVPADVAGALLAAVRGWGDTPVAVRSSGVDEDSADASYAGLFTSVLDVRGDAALLDAVRTCWRSASDRRVTAYGGDGAPRMAVLVQPMVPATVAGVAFTADPVTGQRDRVVIDAVAGTGEKLVSGAVTPERWVVRDGHARHREPPDPPAAPAGRPAAAPAGEPTVPVLDEPRARRIADLAGRAAAELGGGPQDVEWALAGDRLVLLQARPITALPVEPVPIPVRVPPGHWTREGSHAPRPWLPFSRAVAELRNGALRRLAVEAGLLFDGVEFREIGGWNYVRVVPLGGRTAPRPPDLLAPVALRLSPAVRRRTRAAVAAVRADLPGRILADWSGGQRAEFAATIRRLRSLDLDPLPDPALAAHLAAALDLVVRGVEVHFRLHGALAVALGELAFTCRDLLGWDEARTLSLLVGTSTTSAEPARALAGVAALAGPAVRGRLAEGAPVDEVLAAEPGFAEAFAGHLARYGCRALSYELAEPSLEERPGWCWG